MTPAVNILKKNKKDFKIHKYDHNPLCTNYGQEAASKLGLDENVVFKTLVASLNTDELVVCIIPVNSTLSLKEVANVFDVKSAKMADKTKVQSVTGYILGGVSPFGQKKRLKTILDSSAFLYDTIFVSGGKRGFDIEVKPADIIEILDAKKEEIKQTI